MNYLIANEVYPVVWVPESKGTLKGGMLFINTLPIVF